MKIKSSVSKLLLIGTLAFASSMPNLAAATIKENYKVDQLISLLKADGYSNVKKDEDGDILLKIDGTTYNVIVYDNRIQLRWATAGLNTPLTTINKWNYEKGLAKAYLDKDGDPNLDFDLYVRGGISDKTFIKAVSAFPGFVQEFTDFVRSTK